MGTVAQHCFSGRIALRRSLFHDACVTRPAAGRPSRRLLLRAGQELLGWAGSHVYDADGELLIKRPTGALLE
jgi:hypothetical protein